MRRIFFALVLVASACGDDDTGSQTAFDARVPDAPSPDAAFALAAPADRAALFQNGPYAVGYRTTTISYRPAGVATDRSVKVDLWYPATAGTGEDTVYSVAGVIAVPRPGPRTNATPLAEGKFPVVMYSHGSGGVALAAYSYGEYFASWGFVFAAPDHTGNTAIDRSAPFTLSELVRPQDISATLDWVQGESPLKGRTSGDISAIGHSFGGYTVLSLIGAIGDWAAQAAGCPTTPDAASCAILTDSAARAKLDAGFRDPRFELAIAQTPVILTFPAAQIEALDKPVMYVTSRRDQTLPWDVDGEPGWQLFDDPRDVWVDLLNGGHYSMVAVCDVVAPEVLAAVGLDVAKDGCGPDFTPISEIVPAVTAYAHAFIRLQSLGETRWAAVLGGDPFHPQIKVTVGAQ